jgi:hypothetical protein
MAKKKGFMTPERKKKLRTLLRKKAVEELKKEQVIKFCFPVINKLDRWSAGYSQRVSTIEIRLECRCLQKCFLI